MMSIEVENNSEHGAKFKMTQLDVDVTNAVVTSLDSAELTKVQIMSCRAWRTQDTKKLLLTSFFRFFLRLVNLISSP